MTSDSLSLLDNRLNRIHNKHVGDLLSLLDESVSMVKVNRRSTINDSLEHFKQATLHTQLSYAQQIRGEIVNVVSQTQQIFDIECKTEVLKLVPKYFTKTLYLERFRIYEEALNRHVSRYGIVINLIDYNFDLAKAVYHAGSANFIRSSIAEIADDLELIVLRPESVSNIEHAAPESKLEQANRFLIFEPNVFGMGVNLNYLFRRILGKKK